MKRFSILLLAAALLCALAVPAAADVAYMPRDDFYEKHMSECRYLDRWFYANGPEGYVLAHKSPDSAEATPLPNGGLYYVSYVYQDKWGVVEYDPDSLKNLTWNGDSGWVKLSEMVADYDSDSFMAEHGKALSNKTADLEWDGTVYSYKYPGSGVVTDELEADWFGDDTLPLSPLFTDPAGRQWGYCSYFYGHRDLWICIDDPHNSALPPDENCVTFTFIGMEPTEAPDPSATPAPDKTVTLTPPADDETIKQAEKDNRGNGPYLVAGAAGVVVVAAAVLIAALRKKRK